MIQYNSEISRKIVHLSSLWIPILYFFSTAKIMLVILGSLSLIALIVEISRKISPELNALIDQALGKIMRGSEKNSISGATYLLLSASLSILLFDKEVAIFALTILIISDTCAALIGRKFGQHKIFEKTLEGSLGFFLSAVIVYYFLVILGDFALPLRASLLAIFSATILELFAQKIRLDDNLIVPLIVGLVFSIS